MYKKIGRFLKLYLTFNNNYFSVVNKKQESFLNKNSYRSCNNYTCDTFIKKEKQVSFGTGCRSSISILTPQLEKKIAKLYSDFRQTSYFNEANELFKKSYRPLSRDKSFLKRPFYHGTSSICAESILKSNFIKGIIKEDIKGIDFSVVDRVSLAINKAWSIDFAKLTTSTEKSKAMPALFKINLINPKAAVEKENIKRCFALELADIMELYKKEKNLNPQDFCLLHGEVDNQLFLHNGYNCEFLPVLKEIQVIDYGIIQKPNNYKLLSGV